MQGAVASSGWQGTWRQSPVPRQGCPWPSQAHPFVDALWTSPKQELCVAPCSIRHRTKPWGAWPKAAWAHRAHCSSMAVCPALGLSLTSLFSLLLSPFPSRPVGWRAPAVGSCSVVVVVLCVSLCRHQQSPQAALCSDSTSHVTAAANPTC